MALLSWIIHEVRFSQLSLDHGVHIFHTLGPGRTAAGRVATPLVREPPRPITGNTIHKERVSILNLLLRIDGTRTVLKTTYQR